MDNIVDFQHFVETGERKPVATYYDYDFFGSHDALSSLSAADYWKYIYAEIKSHQHESPDSQLEVRLRLPVLMEAPLPGLPERYFVLEASVQIQEETELDFDDD